MLTNAFRLLVKLILFHQCVLKIIVCNT